MTTKLLLSALFLSAMFLNQGFALTTKPKHKLSHSCPATPKQAKYLIEELKTPEVLNDPICDNEIMEHFRRGETSWIEIAPLLHSTGNTMLSESVSYNLSLAIPRNPETVLAVIAQYPLFNDRVNTLCKPPFFAGTVTAKELKHFKHSAVQALRQADIPENLDALRKQCIMSFL